MYAGRPLIAKPHYEKLLKNDPLTPINYLFLGFNYYALGRYEKAMELFQKSSQFDPDFFWGNYWYAIFHGILNKSEESFRLLDQAAKQEHLPEVHVNLIHFYKLALKGEKEKAMDELTDETKKYIWNDPDLTGLMPGWYALIGQKEDSLKILEHAINRGWINYPLFNENDPLLENIRGEPRFKKLMERVKQDWENFEV